MGQMGPAVPQEKPVVRNLESPFLSSIIDCGF